MFGLKVGLVALIYLVVIVIQVFLSLLKKSHFGFILPIISSIIFLIIQDYDFYFIIVAELIVFAITRIVLEIIKAIKEKKSNTNLDNLKIKDI
jgi:hypothetical protein